MFKSNVYTLRILHVLLIVSAIALPFIVELNWSLWYVPFIVYFLTGCLGITMTYHRSLMHKSFIYKHKWLEYLLTYLGAVNCTGSSIGWSLVHWEHHEHADTEKDPHSLSKGLKFFVNVNYENISSALKHYLHLLRDKFHMFIHKYYLLIILSHATIIFLLFGLNGLYFGFILASILGIAGSVYNNLFAHNKFGYRNYNTDDNSKNVWWVALFTFGEGWHNNHHAEPWTWTFSRKWYEIDVTSFVIRILFFTRLAREGVKW